jgi:hypothetical protein
MEQDERFERVRALLRQLQSRLPRLSDASLAANATLDHALEMLAAMESAALQFKGEPDD